jgi:hypothetical protein
MPLPLQPEDGPVLKTLTLGSQPVKFLLLQQAVVLVAINDAATEHTQQRLDLQVDACEIMSLNLKSLIVLCKKEGVPVVVSVGLRTNKSTGVVEQMEQASYDPIRQKLDCPMEQLDLITTGSYFVYLCLNKFNATDAVGYFSPSPVLPPSQTYPIPAGICEPNTVLLDMVASPSNRSTWKLILLTPNYLCKCGFKAGPGNRRQLVCEQQPGRLHEPKDLDLVIRPGNQIFFIVRGSHYVRFVPDNNNKMNSFSVAITDPDPCFVLSSAICTRNFIVAEQTCNQAKNTVILADYFSEPKVIYRSQGNTQLLRSGLYF